MLPCIVCVGATMLFLREYSNIKIFFNTFPTKGPTGGTFKTVTGIIKNHLFFSFP